MGSNSVGRIFCKELRSVKVEKILELNLLTSKVVVLQAAHVGVGISGVEGLQAASASDYAIAQVTQHVKTQFRQQLSDAIQYSAMRIFHATRECFALEIH